MLTRVMMEKLETLVIRAHLERKDHKDHLEKMPSAIMVKMVNQVTMESLAMMGRRERLVLLALKECKEFQRPSNMASVSNSCSIWLVLSRRDSTSAVMDTIITREMLNLVKKLSSTQRLTIPV